MFVGILLYTRNIGVAGATLQQLPNILCGCGYTFIYPQSFRSILVITRHRVVGILLYTRKLGGGE